MGLMLYLLGVLAMVLGIGASIALHEIGHLVPAKLFGVKCRQYMVGFGPTIWSRRRGETEYGIKAIPLGGYVRMIGMFPPRPSDPDGTVRASSTGRWSAMVDDARSAALEEIEPGDEDRVFYRLSTPKKVVVMLGGPVMNLLIGAVLITGLVTIHGVAEVRGAAVASVAQCITPATLSGTTPDCTGLPASPAAQAGLRAADRIESINGKPVTTPVDVGALVRPHAGEPVAMVVLRDGERVRLNVTPVATQVPTLNAEGEPVLDAAGSPVTEKVGLIGTTTSPILVNVPQPIGQAPPMIADMVTRTAGVLLRLPEKMVGVWQAAFGSQARDVEGPMSVVGVGRLAGEKASGMSVGPMLDQIEPVPFLINLLASLNIALFVFNLIPLMPLDGGHVLGALWEGLKRTIARVLHRPDPGYVDVAKGLPIAYAVSVVLIIMSVLIIYADIVKPVRL
ncbi:M50 family metallopeptidase [Gephyromycinifex aptenodytis]|uniref:M50 family metallopeptidase n=1 Tax=Gephyromycinifex aptenodytis TaxID=2716227 RepID=UPI001D0136FC|nr:site-2 protease family protein [Gephyromycinifex aptenodytis]